MDQEFQQGQANAADDGLWQECLDRLAVEVPSQQFGAWLKPLRAQYMPASATVQLLVPNRIALDYIRGRYLERIVGLLNELSGRELRIELGVAARGGAVAGAAGRVVRRPARVAPPPAAAAGADMESLVNRVQADLLAQLDQPPGSEQAHRATQAMRYADHDGEVTAPVVRSNGFESDDMQDGRAHGQGVSAGQDGSAAKPVPSRLNPQLTFENLIEGSANRMARAAALHVAHAPGQLYNPLFIYGGVGLGKTHLMHAVGNQVLRDQPQAKVLYIHAEQFVTDVVKSYQRKTFDALKQRYHSLDLLLIDDVQFIAGKERTQEEFFNAFEALLSKKSHIVMTSDTYPKGLTDIHERLVSRFDAGLTVAIEPPELEMRVAILINKAKAEGIALSEDVAFFVAKNVRSNVRELEGALRKVLAYARFNSKDISIPVAREALRDLLSIQNRQISVENIQKTVADFYKIKVADMYSKKRPASIARPRQIAMYLSKELTQKSLPEIGELFGGRDHTTVLHAVRKIAQERQQQIELNQQLHVLEQTLKR
ncbi:chromosomal replication initiator protein DnaA [Lampropedia puyangensis]|uniref:Chromosomal replication initiator protein DnaA n=1 Tax=Lampropedia puyangensis TaxID=1330072 RepID=A0A4S8FAI2_9BURK|nr:chromosomal replication initiator protein DnaA [Lampropedia puyangensis]THU04598.1 chromosomal replication initiator protein DnaA [Lampropedia puyangensis]